MEWLPIAGLVEGAVGAGSTAVAMGLLLAVLLAGAAVVLVIGARRPRPARRSPSILVPRRLDERAPAQRRVA